MSERMTAQLVRDALKVSLRFRGMPTGISVHSDRGGEFYSKAYQAVPGEHGMSCSMSRSSCQGDACAGSFIHWLTVEAVYGWHIGTWGEMRQTVSECSEVD
ncbi:MAG: hypothetical protein CME43_15545 [Haliea sp.]|uniref:DDE-type integrase/transposase/recombinase n=1 Tax=Haliea sp. TaxID=1932666 RepID=UPI000C5CED7B|nr:hypothetical protein [Haliea sp.]